MVDLNGSEIAASQIQLEDTAVIQLEALLDPYAGVSSYQEYVKDPELLEGEVGSNTIPLDCAGGQQRSTLDLGISLRMVHRLREVLRREFGEDRFQAVTTEQVVQDFVRRRTEEGFSRLGELEDIFPRHETGAPLFMVSHAWDAPVSLTLDAIEACLVNFHPSTKVWLDFVAMSQHRLGDMNGHNKHECPHRQQQQDQDDFNHVIRLCEGGTIVAVNSHHLNLCKNPQCLHDWLRTIEHHSIDRLHFPLISLQQRSYIITAICFKGSNSKNFHETDKILNKIVPTYGSIENAETFLRLQIGLRPTSRASELMYHRRECLEDDHWLFQGIDDLLQPESSSRALCVIDGAGTGKTTICAAVLDYVEDRYPEALVAIHFFKFNDFRSLDPSRALSNLIAQLALSKSTSEGQQVNPVLRQLEAGTREAQAQEPLDDPVVLLRTLQQATANTSGQMLLILDGVDEADPVEEQLEEFQGTPLALGNSALQQLRMLTEHLEQADRLKWSIKFLVTSRPQVLGGNTKPALQRIFQGAASFCTCREMREPREWVPLSQEERTSLFQRTRDSSSELMAYVDSELLLYGAVVRECGLDKMASKCTDPTLADLHQVYEEAFCSALSPLDHDTRAQVVRLVEVLLAAREPVSPARLQAMDLHLPNLAPLLPGSLGVLCNLGDRGRGVQLAHKSVADWLLGRQGGSQVAVDVNWAVDLREGHLQWARHLAGSLETPDPYCVSYMFEHVSRCSLSRERDSILDALVVNVEFLARVVVSGPKALSKVVRCLGSLSAPHTVLSKEALMWLRHGQVRMQRASLHAQPYSSRVVEQILSNAKLVAPPYSHLIQTLRGKYPGWWCTGLMGSTHACAGSGTWSSATANFRGHQGPVWGVALSPDGRQVASGGGADEEVKIWDTATNTCRACFKGHTGEVLCVKFFRCGALLASASVDKTVRIWDLLTGECHMVLEGHTGPVKCVALSGDGSTLVSGGGEYWEPGELKVWDLHTGVCTNTLRDHTRKVYSAALSADGKVLVSSSDRRELKVFDLTRGVCTNSLELGWSLADGHSDAVFSVALSADGKVLVSGGGDWLIKVWDVPSGKCIQTLEGHRQWVLSVSLSADCQRLVSGCGSYDTAGELKVWDLKTGTCVRTLEGHTDSVNSVQLSDDGLTLVSGGHDKTVKLWDLSMGEDPMHRDSTRGHKGQVHTVALSGDGSTLVSGGGEYWEPGELKVWDLHAGVCTNTLEGHRDPVTCVALSRDGSLLASGGGEQWQGELKFWHLPAPLHQGGLHSYNNHSPKKNAISHQTIKARCITDLQGHTQPVSCVAMSGSGDVVASGSGVWRRTRLSEALRGCGFIERMVSAAPRHEGRLQVWQRLRDGRMCLSELNDVTSPVYCLALSCDGRLLVSGGADGRLKVWRQVKKWRFLCSGSSPNSWTCSKTLKGHVKPVYTLALGRSGKMLVSGGGEENFPGELKVWDLKTGKCTQNLLRHFYSGRTCQSTDSSVHSVSLSDDERVLVSGSANGVIHVWDLNNGDCVEIFEGDFYHVNSVALSADAQLLVSGGSDHVLRIWEKVNKTEKSRTSHRRSLQLPDCNVEHDGKEVQERKDKRTSCEF